MSRRTLRLTLLAAGLLLAARILAPGSAPAQEKAPPVVIAGAGNSQELLTNMALRFMRENPSAPIEVAPATSSEDGIKAVLAGTAELARTDRPLRNEEIAAGMTETVFATAPVVFAVNPGVTGVTNITAAQAVAVFSGKITDWSALGGPAGPIFPVCRKAPETSRDVLDAAIPGFAATPCQGPGAAASTPRAVALAAGHAGGIGYCSLPAMTASRLTPLAYDGIDPTPENLGRGRYPLVIPLALAYKPPLSPTAAGFLAFMSRPDSRWLLTKFGCLPQARKPAAP